MSELKSSRKSEDGLKALIDAKIINPNITLSNLLDIAKRLDSDDDGIATAWQVIVKGKYIWKDDAKATKAVVGDWPEE